MIAAEPTVVDFRADDTTKLFEQIRSLLPLAEPRPLEAPLSNLIAMLEKLGCTSVLVEYPYQDQDFMYDYAHAHTFGFQELGRLCARAHFFSGKPLSKVDPISDLRRYDVIESGSMRRGNPQETETHGRYLGYIVIRPTGPFCIGKTILRQPYAQSKEDHIHVRSSHRTYVFGVELEVDGTPFIQSDKTSHVCAGAALWCLCYGLHRSHGTPRLFPQQITRIARTEPYKALRTPLTPAETARVISHLGCAVDAKQVLKTGEMDVTMKRKKLRRFVDAVYGYVASGVPVVIGYWHPKREVGHAVLVVGYHFRLAGDPVSPPDSRPKKGPMMDSDYVDYFYVQDDCRSTYHPLRIWGAEKAGRDAPPSLEATDGFFFAAGLPSATQLLYHEALKVIRRVFDDDGFNTEDKPEVDELRASRWRLLFQESRRFKASLLNKRNGGTRMQAVLAEAYLAMPMPLYVYVAEFLRPAASFDSGVCSLGEIVLDPTSPNLSTSRSVIAYRVKDNLYAGPALERVAEDSGYFDNNLDHHPEALVCTHLWEPHAS